MTQTRKPTGAALLRTSVTDAITQAVLSELREKGYARVSMEQVAKTAGVGKSALYRRWSSKQAMMTDVLSQLSDSQPPPKATGDFRGDVRALVRRLEDYVRDENASTMITDVIAEALRSPEVDAAVNEALVHPRRAAATALIESSEEGQRLSRAQKDMLLDVVSGTLFWRFCQGRPTTRRDLKMLEDIVVAGFETL